VHVRRTVLGMSREKLADALGVTVPTVYEWETGISRIGAARLNELAEFSACRRGISLGTGLMAIRCTEAN